MHFSVSCLPKNTLCPSGSYLPPSAVSCQTTGLTNGQIKKYQAQNNSKQWWNWSRQNDKLAYFHFTGLEKSENFINMTQVSGKAIEGCIKGACLLNVTRVPLHNVYLYPGVHSQEDVTTECLLRFKFWLYEILLFLRSRNPVSNFQIKLCEHKALHEYGIL